jgi:hypothetical protein
MMDDFEERLRRYRPVGPPSDLRAGIVAAAGKPASVRWAWIPSAAAAAAAFAFYVLAASARRDLAADLTKTDPRREAIIRALAADLGGGDEAGKMAARLIEMNEATEAPGLQPGTALDGESTHHD